MQILVADDSALLREKLVKRLAKASGVEALQVASNETEILQAIQAFAPGVVILGIQTPSRHWFRIVRAVKQQQPTPVVIVFTNFPDAQHWKNFAEAGADYFLDKALELKKLLNIIRLQIREAS
jgi:DNA-binding NarL/FixJ family response regulator